MLTTFAVLAGLLAPPAATGTIDVDVTPSNAVVEIDGKAVINRKVKVKVGSHKVTARAKGYASQTRNVTVNANQTARVPFRLTKVGTVKPPVVKGPDSGGGKTPTVGGGGRAPAAGGKTPIVIGKGGSKGDTPVKPGIKVTPKENPKVTPKVTPKTDDDRPAVVKRPKTGPAAGKRNPPARGNVNNGGGARGSRDSGGGGGSLRPLAVLSFVVGGLAITGGVITHGIAEDKAEDFNASRDRQEKLDLRDEAKGYDTASTVLYGVGATGVALGILLLAVDTGDSRATVSPLPEGGAMIGYGGTF